MSTDIYAEQQSLGLGSSDKRGTHDRTAYRVTTRVESTFITFGSRENRRWLLLTHIMQRQGEYLRPGKDSDSASGRRKLMFATSFSRTTSRTRETSLSLRPRQTGQRTYGIG